MSRLTDAEQRIIELGSWVCGRCGHAPESHAASDCIYDPVFRAALARPTDDPKVLEPDTHDLDPRQEQ